MNWKIYKRLKPVRKTVEKKKKKNSITVMSFSKNLINTTARRAFYKSSNLIGLFDPIGSLFES